jgi:hypothetical protein
VAVFTPYYVPKKGQMQPQMQKIAQLPRMAMTFLAGNGATSYFFQEVVILAV